MIKGLSLSTCIPEAEESAKLIFSLPLEAALGGTDALTPSFTLELKMVAPVFTNYGTAVVNHERETVPEPLFFKVKNLKHNFSNK